MIRVLRYLVTNGLLVTLLYFGLVEGVSGALNVGLFMVWSISILSLFWVNDDVVNSIAKSKWIPSVPMWVDVVFDLCIVALLVWYSCFASGVAYLIHILMGVYLDSKVKEIRGEDE